MMRPAIFALPLSLALAACVSFHTIDDGIARARIGETVSAGSRRSETVSVSPVRVMEDSRCPMGVACIQAGTVRLAVRIDGAAPIELRLGQPVVAGAGELTLVEVYPERRKDTPIYPDEYRFGFRFIRRPA